MDEVLINAKTSRFPPAIAGNGGSDFVVIWNDPGAVNLNGLVFRARGGTSGSVFPINTPTDGTHTLPAVAMMAGFSSPGFVVTWIADGPAGRHVLLQRFDPDGTKRGGEVRVNTTDISSDHRPVIMRLSDLNIVVSWVSARLDEGIRAKIFTPDGANVGEEFRVNTSEGVHFAPVGTELDDGGFVIGWQGGPNFGRTFARFRMFQPNGTPSGPEIVPNIVGFHDEMAMTFLAAPQNSEPGHFAIAYTTSAPDQIIVASLFGPDGTLKNSTNVTHRADQTIGSQLAMRALPSQRLVVTWTERFVPEVGDRTEDNVMAKVLVEDSGNILIARTEKIQVNTTPAGNQNCPCVATSLDEQGVSVVIAWIDDSVSGSGSPLRAVKARSLPGSVDPV